MPGLQINTDAACQELPVASCSHLRFSHTQNRTKSETRREDMIQMDLQSCLHHQIREHFIDK